MHGLPFLHDNTNTSDKAIKFLAKELDVPVITFGFLLKSFDMSAPFSNWSDVDAVIAHEGDTEDGESIYKGMVVKNESTEKTGSFSLSISDETHHVMSLVELAPEYEVVA
jgi:hypothetical protein